MSSSNGTTNGMVSTAKKLDDVGMRRRGDNVGTSSLLQDDKEKEDEESTRKVSTSDNFIIDDNEEEDEDEQELKSIAKNMCTNWNALHILYLSLFSVIGVSVRVFVGRFFGGDCESNFQGHTINDWMWPLSHKICITADGQTEQYGGALFIDLPANMLGSLLMGYFTGHYHMELPALPCMHHDHPLQTEEGLHAGLKTALCGSFTTFSSWNSQMVLMMDGTANPYLGSQVLAALFGYIIGLQAAVTSFRVGRSLAACTHVKRNPHVFDSAMSKMSLIPRWHHRHLSWITPVVVCILIALIICLYIAGDLYWGIAFYRQLWIACLSCPLGTILRWKLSTLNGRLGYPTGTFMANFLASILSAGLTAWSIIESIDKGAQRWEIPAIKAVSLGVAGSLSTVSTFAKECVEMTEKDSLYSKKQFYYSHGTMLICCFVGLAVYSPIVRYGEGGQYRAYEESLSP